MQKKISDIKNKEQEYTTPYYKLVLIGENEVGKTQMLHRLNDENFEERYSPTFGVDFRVKSFFGEKGKLLYDLQIIDIAGETDQIHLRIEKDFIKEADAFLCLFDLSDDFSLNRNTKIVDEYKDLIGDKAEKKKWYLVGNKKDIDINSKGIPYYYKAKFKNYFEVSCKTSKKEEFQKIIELVTYDLSKKENEEEKEKEKEKEKENEEEKEKENEEEKKKENEEENSNNDAFEIDFIKKHENLFDEECIIF